MGNNLLYPFLLLQHLTPLAPEPVRPLLRHSASPASSRKHGRGQATTTLAYATVSASGLTSMAASVYTAAREWILNQTILMKSSPCFPSSRPQLGTQRFGSCLHCMLSSWLSSCTGQVGSQEGAGCAMHPHFLFLEPQWTPSHSFRLSTGDASSVEASLEACGFTWLLWPTLTLPVYLREWHPCPPCMLCGPCHELGAS